jgi:molybdopterin converting factor small subunit
LVKIRINSVLQQYYGVPGEIDANGNTVGECLADIIRKYPRARDWLENTAGLLQLVISVNKDRTVSPNEEGLATPVKDGDELGIFALIGGG